MRHPVAAHERRVEEGVDRAGRAGPAVVGVRDDVDVLVGHQRRGESVVVPADPTADRRVPVVEVGDRGVLVDLRLLGGGALGVGRARRRPVPIVIAIRVLRHGNRAGVEKRRDAGVNPGAVGVGIEGDDRARLRRVLQAVRVRRVEPHDVQRTAGVRAAEGERAAPGAGRGRFGGATSWREEEELPGLGVEEHLAERDDVALFTGLVKLGRKEGVAVGLPGEDHPLLPRIDHEHGLLSEREELLAPLLLLGGELFEPLHTPDAAQHGGRELLGRDLERVDRGRVGHRPSSAPPPTDRRRRSVPRVWSRTPPGRGAHDPCRSEPAAGR